MRGRPTGKSAVCQGGGWDALLCALLLLACGLYGDGPCASAQTMYWDGGFGSVAVPALTSRSDQQNAGASATLILTGDVELTADTSSTAQLSEPGGDTLVTEYRLTFDGNGTSNSGASNVAYTSYSSFLQTPATVTHVTGDDDVVVSLFVRASHPANGLADAGTYGATQTLTVSWVGP